MEGDAARDGEPRDGAAGPPPPASPWPEIGDIGAAFAFLTRLPAPVDHGRAGARVAAAAWAWPLAGAAVGALAGGAFLGAAALGAAPGLGATLALAVALAATGALHEDGLADCADGFWGGADRERRLAIMRDSRLGAFGVAALTLLLLGRWSVLSGLDPWAAPALLAAAGALARAPLPAALRLAPPARPGGLAAGAGRPAGATALLAGATALALAAGLAGPLPALAALGAAAAATAACVAIARGKIGGVTGDVLGAAATLGELAALAVLAG